MTSDNRTNSVIVSLPGKQYFKSVTVIIIATSIPKKKKSVVKLYYFRKHSSFFFRIFLMINLQYDEETNRLEAIVIYSRSSDNQVDYVFLNYNGN